MHVLVHGGAGRPPDDPAAARYALDAAATSAADADRPLAAVRTAVRILESDPQFNAGVGSAIQSDGTIRTDAGVTTSEGEVGAACAMPGVEHAVDVAWTVATETPHVLLAGERAVAFAASHGIETDCDLRTEVTRERWAGEDAPADAPPDDQLAWVRGRFGDDGDRRAGADRDFTRDHDTVGAVAADGDRVAAATSTGGRWGALAGRVGDVPQIGGGFYASDAGAASATGAGEDIARVGLARAAVERLADGTGPDAAAREAIAEFERRADGHAGLIVIHPTGATGSAFDSVAMPTATADDS